MYQACIFDLDGTLANTVESIAQAANRILAGFGLAAQPTEDYKYFAGDGGDVLMERCMRAAGGDFTHLADAQRQFREFLARDPLYKVTAYDGIPEALKELKARGVKLAVLSNKPHEAACLVVRGLFGAETFDWIQGQEPGLARKPDPAGAHKIAKIFGVSEENCLYLGDTNTDMRTGKAAGMYTVGVLWGFRDRKELEENHADRLIERPEEILKVCMEEP